MVLREDQQKICRKIRWREEEVDSHLLSTSCSLQTHVGPIIHNLQTSTHTHKSVPLNLFPRLPRCHLRKVAPVVKELCKKHNLPYRSLSWWEANVWTIRTLKKAAYQARDAANPVVKNLVWEALNTHG